MECGHNMLISSCPKRTMKVCACVYACVCVCVCVRTCCFFGIFSMKVELIAEWCFLENQK